MKNMIASITTCLILLGVAAGIAIFSDRAHSEEGKTRRRAFIVSHFHYDPVWTNSQAGETMRAFSIMNQNLEFAAAEPRFVFVLSEIDYLMPYWDAYPLKRDPLLSLVEAGRVEFTGGYSEPDEAAVGGEALIRNFAYGKLYKEARYGAKVETVGQHDVFGHAVQTPQILLKTGHVNAQFQRGNLTDLPPDFMWLAPDGSSILSRRQDYGGTSGDVLYLGTDKSMYPFTNTAIFMSGGDFSAPDRNIMKFTKKTKTYMVQAGTHRDFFNAERADIRDRGLVPPEISRDHTPLLPGCYSSRVDTKLANRWAETTLTDAEKFAVIASLYYDWNPNLDKAWRLLLFGQHHDALTGSDTENVNLDLLTQWRESLTIATAARDQALSLITGKINTESPDGGVPVVLFNSLNWDRTEPVRIQAALLSEWKGFRVLDAAGKEVSFQLAAAGDAPFKNVDILIAADAPSMGYAVYRIVEAPDLPADAMPKKVQGVEVESDFFRVKVDPARGGGIVSLFGKKENKEYMDASTGVGNEIFAIKENNAKVEGPWSIHSTGQVWRSSKYAAESVSVEDGPVTARIIVESAPRRSNVKIFGGDDNLLDTREQEVLCRMIQEIIVYKHLRRIDFRTHLIDYKETDFMYKVGFPASVKGALPVFGERFAAVGREKNTEEFLFYDFWREPGVKRGREYPADTWMDYTSPARLEFTGAGGAVEGSMALALGEIVVPDNNQVKQAVNTLARAFVRKGVTSTITAAVQPRTNRYYGFRVSIGMGDNAYSTKALEAAPGNARKDFQKQLDEKGFAFLLVQPAESVTLGVYQRPIPVLIIEARDAAALDAAAAVLADQLEKDGNLKLPQSVNAAGVSGTVEPFGVALLNRGHAGNSVEQDGTMTLTLMRSSTGWPSGRLYSRNLEIENWNHVYEYALMPHEGDWRAAKSFRAGEEFNHPFYAVVTTSHTGDLPAALSFLSTPGTDAIITAIKPAGFGASGAEAVTTDRFAVRLYDPTGFKSNGKIEFVSPLKKAEKTDMIEQGGTDVPVAGNSIVIGLKPFSIDTYLLEPSKSPVALPPSPADIMDAAPPPPVFARYWETNEGVAPESFPKVSAVIEMGEYSSDRKELTAIVTVATDGTLAEPAFIYIMTPPGVIADPRYIELSPGSGDARKPRAYTVKLSGIDVSKLSSQYISVEVNLPTSPEDFLTFNNWKVFSGDASGAEQPGFDDTAWETLPLARFWSRGVSAPVTWYRRRMVIPQGMGDMQMFFDRPAGAVVTAYINGEQVQKSADGYQVGPLVSASKIEYGKENLIAIRVEYNGSEPISGTAFHGSETMFNNNLWRLEKPEVRVARGGNAKMTVFFKNPMDQALEILAVLSSPVETWDVGGPHGLIKIGPWSLRMFAKPNAEVPATFYISAPPDADPGRHVAAVKFIYAGIPVYSGLVDIIVEP